MQLARNFSKFLLRDLLLYLSQSSSKNVNEGKFRVLQFILKHPKEIQSYIEDLQTSIINCNGHVRLDIIIVQYIFHILEKKFSAFQAIRPHLFYKFK